MKRMLWVLVVIGFTYCTKTENYAKENTPPPPPPQVTAPANEAAPAVPPPPPPVAEKDHSKGC